MAKIFDDIEVGLTMDEVRQALRAWVDKKMSLHNYLVTTVTLHPNAKHVVRFAIEPPLSPEDKIVVAATTKTLEPFPT